MQSQNLNLQQAQSLTLTKELQQAIKLLQLSQMELAQYIETELLQNPLLELIEDNQSPDENHDSSESEGDADQLDFYSKESTEKTLDTDFDNVWEPNLSLTTHTKSSHYSDDFDHFQNHFEEESLKDHLLKQLSHGTEDQLVKGIGFYLIDHLSEHGYFHHDLNDIAKDLKVDIEKIEEALTLIQHFDPPGIGARNLAECLRLQLDDQGLINETSLILLDNLPLIAQKNLKVLEQKTNLKQEKLIEWIEIIQKLNPYPATSFGSIEPQTIIPDLYLILLPTGDFKIELNQENLPKIGLNKNYYQTLKTSVLKTDDKNFVQNAYQNASWLMKAIDQRATTLVRVAEQIVKHQFAFFQHGLSHLKPLILKEIAEITTLHESTISRVTTNKYMATPNGIFELKFFFSSSLQNAFGDQDISSEFVRQRIKNLIQNEVFPNILADDTLVGLLQKEGITIARRTVTKYRESMNIQSSIVRRQQKRPLTQTEK